MLRGRSSRCSVPGATAATCSGCSYRSSSRCACLQFMVGTTTSPTCSRVFLSARWVSFSPSGLMAVPGANPAERSGPWTPQFAGDQSTTPNQLLAEVHDRMPVILPPTSYDLWLDPGFRDAAATSEMLKPYDAGLMRLYAVSTRVNNATNDDHECSEPIEVQGRCRPDFSEQA